MTITIEELRSIEPGLLWEPRQREVTEEFLRRKTLAGEADEEALHTVAYEAHRILGRCVPPTEPGGSGTGLVVGYVQSGKTLSFTTLTALARDNGYGLVILIAGTIDNLKSQSQERLKQDLGVSPDNPGQPWVLIDNPARDNSEFEALRGLLQRWRSPALSPRKKKTILVTVLKQHQRLANLVECLSALSASLQGVPCLVIDDEADQASLNNFAAKNQKTRQNALSANYREVLNLKAVLPHHTYLQYTATPQAPLLIGLTDILSPDFAETLTPGRGYTGGQTLFQPGAPYARVIPDAEAVATAASHPAAPPSLVSALKVFLLGACAHALAEHNSNRSMMVHPSQQTAPQTQYIAWLTQLMGEWRSRLPVQALRNVLMAEFADAYADLRGTVGEALAGLADLFAKMDEVLHIVRVREVNSTGKGAAAIRWGDNEYWILVGGQKLDRGYTVKGLTVTYMPRPLGVGNADNIQQRARFYGYKASYLGYCRVYVRQDVKTAFEGYVEHESFIRSELETSRGQPLKEWRRRFILADRLQPTRRGVMGIKLDEVTAAEWLFPGAAHVGKPAVAHNRIVFDRFLQHLRTRFVELAAHEAAPDRYLDKRANSSRNKLFEAVSVADVCAHLIDEVQFGTVEDATERMAISVALGRLLAVAPNATCDVFLVGDMVEQGRSLTKKGTINQVFSGKSPNTSDRARLKYCGDRELRTDNRVTVHLRKFHFLISKVPPQSGDASSDVPWLAIYIPDELKRRILLQPVV